MQRVSESLAGKAVLCQFKALHVNGDHMIALGCPLFVTPLALCIVQEGKPEVLKQFTTLTVLTT